jgi:hypothetical protein
MCNKDFIHNLFTAISATTLNNLWVSCGSAVHCTETSRIVNVTPVDMQLELNRWAYSIEFDTKPGRKLA